jgi:hypothetical protein
MVDLKSYVNILRNFDYFGVHFNLRFKNQENYKSIGGGVASIIFTFLAVYYCLIFFISFATRGQMNLIFNQNYVAPNPTINFTEKNFNLAITTSFDSNNTKVDLSSIGLYEKIYLSTIYNSKNKTKIPLSLRNCQLKDFHNLIDENKFKIIGLDTHRCIENVNDISVLGSYNDPVYRYLEYGVFINSSIFGNLSSPSVEFDSLMKKIYNTLTQNVIKVEVDSLEGTINAYNISSPMNHQIHSFLAILDPSVMQKINIEFLSINFQSDENILFENFYSKTSAIFDNYYPYSIALPDKSLVGDEYKYTLLKLYFRSSSKSTTIKRQYQKITDYLANMVGLLGQILFLFFIVFTYVNKFELENKVMNKILKYKEHIQYNQNFFLEEMKKRVFNTDKDLNLSIHEEEPSLEDQEKIDNVIGSTKTFKSARKLSKSSINNKTNKDENDVFIYSMDKTMRKDSLINGGINQIDQLWNKRKSSKKRLIIDNFIAKRMSSIIKSNRISELNGNLNTIGPNEANILQQNNKKTTDVPTSLNSPDLQNNILNLNNLQRKKETDLQTGSKINSPSPFMMPERPERNSNSSFMKNIFIAIKEQNSSQNISQECEAKEDVIEVKEDYPCESDTKKNLKTHNENQVTDHSPQNRKELRQIINDAQINKPLNLNLLEWVMTYLCCKNQKHIYQENAGIRYFKIPFTF